MKMFSFAMLQNVDLQKRSFEKFEVKNDGFSLDFVEWPISFLVNWFCEKGAIFESIFVLWSTVPNICVNRTRPIMTP